MRDILVTVLVFGSIPLILKQPWFGIIVWSWLSFMNPHRMAWGFSTTMPFAYIVAVTTLFSLAISKEPKRIPWTRESILLLLFIAWMCVTTYFAMYPALAQEQLIKVIKIELMTFVAMILITNKQRVNMLVLTIALSIGFYGVKGGIFTIAHGGVYRVQGPPETFIAGNNEIGLALAMTVPLMWYSARQAMHRFLRPLLFASVVLTAIAALGTQSRGALLGIGAMGAMMWLKSRQKFVVTIAVVLSVIAAFTIMPPEWFARMNTIQNYENEGSAVGRINAWRMAVNMASHRPFGGGFSSFRDEAFAMYAPDPEDIHDSHSIYFEVLGHHGWVGFTLFMALAAATWLSAGKVARQARKFPDLQWLAELGAMMQVSLVAFFVAGAFLGLAYFDYYYSLIVIVIAARLILSRRTEIPPQVANPAVTRPSISLAAPTVQAK